MSERARPSQSPSQQEMLFGADAREGLVAIEALDDTRMVVWRRHVDGGAHLERLEEPRRPCLFLTDRSLLDGFGGEASVERLAGEASFRELVTVADGRVLERLRRHLVKTSGENPSSPVAPYLYIGDPVHLHLLQSGQTLFKGLRLGDLRRLQLDIETSCAPGFEFSNPERDDDRILSIAVTEPDGYEEVIWAGDLDEGAMIERLGEIIRERDPDVIEGHNLYKFDLDYLRVRAARHDVALRWGRDGSVARFRRSRVQIAERAIDYPLCSVAGRHLIDTWLLVQFYDLGTGRMLESYGLKSVARELGVAEPERELVDGQEIGRVFDEDPERLRRYNLDDCRETARLAALLQESYFIQAKIFPYSYHNTIVRGQATKINALFLRECLRRRQAVPRPAATRAIVGGFTAMYETGVVGPIVHCDVSSLYPSIMLAYEIAPRQDALGIFLPFLAYLRSMRLEAKKAMQQLEEGTERHHLDAMQSTFKILINSFYGYLGSPFANWGDSEAANRVTSTGRELIQSMVRWLEENAARPVEVDTDGIYFVPPEGVDGEADERRLIERLAGTLPSGIDVELAGRYRSMLSYKVKNYALLDYDGRLKIAGSGLRSRGIERYQREFLERAIRLALEGRPGEITALYREVLGRLERHELDVRAFMKTEILAESLAEYRRKIEKKKRNRAAVYELALAADRDYRPGDQLSYYVTGTKKRVRVFDAARPVAAWDAATPDENVAYYQQKLKELFEKFAPVLDVEASAEDSLALE
ncbi:MAG: DNA polymerase domain-containing protein [Candidatus Eiseniibacteriota bacterium]